MYSEMWLKSPSLLFVFGAAFLTAISMASFASEETHWRVIKPRVELSSEYPSLPTERSSVDKGVLEKDSAYFWSAPAGKRGRKPPYRPVHCGFSASVDGADSTWDGRYNHWLIFENNQIRVADRPVARVTSVVFSEMYGRYGTFPITGVTVEDILPHGTAFVTLGSFRFAVEAAGKTVWLDKYPRIEVTYKAGLAMWRCANPDQGIDLTLEIRPNVSARGAIARVAIQRAPKSARLRVFHGALGMDRQPYSNYAWSSPDSTPNPPNRITCFDNYARITSTRLPRAVVLVGVPGVTAATGTAPEKVFDLADSAITPECETDTNQTRQCVRIVAPIAAGKKLHIVAVWGADDYDRAAADEIEKKLNPDAIVEPYRDRVWDSWFDNFIGKQLGPEARFQRLLGAADSAWAEAEDFWADREQRWHIRTPIPELNATGNWVGQTLEYFRQPPGYMVAQLQWNGYGHITSGWHALGAMGDIGQLGDMLSLYAAMRSSPTPAGGTSEADASKKELNWTFLNLDTVKAEPLNAPFVDHVWRWWLWSGDNDWLAALWPAVKDAIAGEMANRDPDGDGLFNGYYEFWDCDAEQRGPKAAGQTAWMISGFRAAARMAKELGHSEDARRYDLLAGKSLRAFQKELWRADVGQAGARTRDGQFYQRASVHEQFIGITRGVLTEKQAAQSLRRLNYLYGQRSRYGVPMLFKNDVWPTIWSQHYMPPGDTCLTYLAATKCGLAGEFYPYVQVVAASVMKSDHAGLGLSVGQDGAIDSMEVGNSDCHAPFAWSIVEGLFGVTPDVDEPGCVRIAPSIPDDWRSASATFGDISLSISKESPKTAVLNVSDRQGRVLRILWPTVRPVESVDVNGRTHTFEVRESVNRSLVEVRLRASKPVKIVLKFQEKPITLYGEQTECVSGSPVVLSVNAGKATSVDDPQGCLSKSSVDKAGHRVTLWPRESGFHTVFVRLSSGNVTYWKPVSFRTGPAWEIVEDYQAADPPNSGPITQVSPKLDFDRKVLSVRLKNRRSEPIREEFKITIAGYVARRNVSISPGQTTEMSVALPGDVLSSLLPGASEFRVEGLGLSQNSAVRAWPQADGDYGPNFPGPANTVLLDIDENRNLTPEQMKKVPMKLDFGGTNTLIGWYNTSFKMKRLPRIYEPLPGLAFALSAQPDTDDGEQMLVLAQAGDPPIPTRAKFDIGERVRRIYVLTIFQYYPIKAYSPQAEWTLEYEDGSISRVPWTPPFGVDSAIRIDSPWSYALPIGESDDPGWNVPSKNLGPIHAQIIDIPADSNRALKSVEARITSTESYMGILGVTLVVP